jgi:hypothetical protein
MKARTSPTTTMISHQYSRISSIDSPVPLRIVSTAKLEEIGEHRANEESQGGYSGAFQDQGIPARSWPIGHG